MHFSSWIHCLSNVENLQNIKYIIKLINLVHSFIILRAALNGHLATLRLLSAYGGDMGVVSSNSDTPLHLAAMQGHGPICKFLAQRGITADKRFRFNYVHVCVCVCLSFWCVTCHIIMKCEEECIFLSKNECEMTTDTGREIQIILVINTGR